MLINFVQTCQTSVCDVQGVDKVMPACIYSDKVQSAKRLVREAVPSLQVILNDLLHGMMRVTKCMNDIPAKGMLLLPQVYPFQSAVSRNAWYT